MTTGQPPAVGQSDLTEGAHTISIRAFSCAVPSTRLAQLSVLVHWCAERTSVDHPTLLASIIVAPKSLIAAAANAFLAEAGDKSHVRSSADAVAVPAVTQGHLQAAIVLDAGKLAALDQGQAEIDSLALTLLEEFLHVRHYAITFERRGFIHYHLQDKCRSWLLEIAYHLLDEYLVGRWKSDLIEGELFYGGSLPNDIDRGLVQLAHIVQRAAKAELDVTTASLATADILIGPTFGALVREAGRRANRSGTPSPAGDPSGSSLFGLHVNEYWGPIRSHLVESFHNPQKADDELLGIAHQLKSFLEHCGITLTPVDDGICWINFANTWADDILDVRVP